MAEKKTHELYVLELKEKGLNIEAIGTYNGANIPILHYCKTHNTRWVTTPHNVLQGSGCPNCRKEKYRKSRGKTNDEYKKEVAIKNPNVIVIGEYVNMDTSLSHYCKKHSVIWDSRPNSILSGSGCPICKKEKFRATRSKSHEEYISELERISSDIIPLETYITARTPILHLCKKHNVEWVVPPDAILSGHGCYLCGHEITSSKNSKSHEQYVDELKNVNPNITCISGYTKATEMARHHCSICGYEWDTIPSYILSGRGCPNCSISHGEQEIKWWLDTNNICYEMQKKFQDCKDKNELPFDFYLPDYNMAIEYDGEQHFRPIDYFGGEKAHEAQTMRDKIKNDYCNKNGIKLLRIPYYKNAKSELNNFLLNIQ